MNTRNGAEAALIDRNKTIARICRNTLHMDARVASNQHTAPVGAIVSALGEAFDAGEERKNAKASAPTPGARIMNGIELQRARKRLGLSVEQMASDLGIKSGDKIREWERRDGGHAEVPTSVAIVVAHWVTDARAGVDRTTAASVQALLAANGLTY